MSTPLKSLLSAVFLFGLLAIGSYASIIFQFATENRALSDFSVRHGQLISVLILGISALIGVIAAAAIFRKEYPGVVAKLTFFLALFILTGVVYICLRAFLSEYF